jgi:hypothetical protein
MTSVIAGALQKGMTLRQVLAKVQGAQDGGKPIRITSQDRCVPYLDSTLAGWVDGPPTSIVCFVLSAQDEHGHGWRRWTISKVGPWQYELGVFPTPFKNERDPLSPGVPPSSSRAG